MRILDSNHISEIERGSAIGVALEERLRGEFSDSVVTIVSAEESMRGWLLVIRRQQDPHAQIFAYERFQNSLAWYSKWTVLAWGRAAADIFTNLRRQGIRIGTQDLKIAAITLANDATLLTSNLADFRQVPGLRVENWLD